MKGKVSGKPNVKKPFNRCHKKIKKRRYFMKSYSMPKLTLIEFPKESVITMSVGTPGGIEDVFGDSGAI